MDVIVIGAGFAGASTAAALARSGVRSGLLVERESLPGSHASGRNAAMARQLESDPAVGKLAVEGVRRLRARRVHGCPVLWQTGGLYLVHEDQPVRATQWIARLGEQDVPSELLPMVEAQKRFPFLCGFDFDFSIFCPTDGVVDIHALLTDLLAEAGQGGFETVTNCAVESLIVEGAVVRGVWTSHGAIGTRVVIDATGAWAGHLGRTTPLPLKPCRRHLFFGGETGMLPRDAPLVWDLDVGYYVRTEGAGLLLCPCDENEHPPGIPAVDFDVAALLADKLLRYAPGLSDVTLRRGWACLRTFAPDRRPVIGWDPNTHGLFHVSGIGGFGVTASLAVGEIASALICGGAADWVDFSCFDAGREALTSRGCC
ncbi:MAG: FAD-dependent oxidoreductase [Bryobacteraceae bacterium]